MRKSIAAIATPLGSSGISVIRISGDEAVKIAEKVFRSADKSSITDMPGYTAKFGYIYADGQKIDEVVLLIFRAPHSYTGEDVVEISCHGGMYITRRVLEAVLNGGAVLAQPGEFTKKAFLNGKLKLTQAEAVADLIAAQNNTAIRAALGTKDGALDREITQIKEVLLHAAANFSAFIDYPDEDIPDIEPEQLQATIMSCIFRLEKLLSSFDSGRIMKEGIETVIAGRPNVGKSTLMNLLSGYERSIVTEIAGTTRDVIEEHVRVGSIVLRLADTAGLRDSTDVIENIGVELAKKRMESAQLIIAVFDASNPFTNEDRLLVDSIKNRTVLAVINKSDLCTDYNTDYIKNHISHTVTISAKTGDGKDRLMKALEEITGLKGFDPGAAYLATERQRDCAVRACDELRQALAALQSGFTLDAVSVNTDMAISALLELLGERVTDAVVDTVFANFCVGK